MNTKTATMNNTRSLCQNCDYTGSCIQELTSQEPIAYCGEFHTTRLVEPEDFTISANDNKNYMGLCSTCDFIKYCTLRSDKQITINCEHYQ